MKMKKNILSVIVITSSIFFSSCLKDKGIEPAPPLENSPQILLQLEASGDLINSVSFPKFISADSLFSILADVVVIDLRAASEFQTARISGSINLEMKNLFNYIKQNVPASKSVVLVDGSSQKSVYAASLLGFAGMQNIVVLRWGLASWNSVIQSWQNYLHFNIHTKFEGKVNSKGTFTPLPKIEESFASTTELIEKRVQSLLSDNFEDLLISSDTLNARKFDYYVVCYGTQKFYRETQSYPGHFKNSILYQPRADFKSNTDLQTLASDRIIGIYDFDGTAAASLSAFLKLLGYNVKFVKFGAHEMIYEHLIFAGGTMFSGSVVRNYPVVSGESF